MKIVKLKAENIKRLVAVEITPKGDIVKISGKNAAGKSSVLDAIWMALKGKAIPSQPVRKGEDKGRVELDLGELTVERRFSGNGTNSLIVANKEGARFTSPQTVLDQLVGDISFDPLEFARSRPADQYRLLADITGLGDKLDTLAAKEKAAFDERTGINREVKRIEGALTRFDELPDEAPDVPDASALVAERQKASEHNFSIQRLRERAEYESRELRIVKARHEEAKRALALAAQAVTDTKQRLDEASASLEKAGDPIDLSSFDDRMAEAEAARDTAHACRQRDELRGELEKQQAESDRLTGQIEKHRKARAAAVSKAKFPVDDLSLEAGAVLFGGIPFDQASSAEQLRVSMAIAMHANPKLRVIRLNNASLLDSEGMKVIEEMAAADDFQVWLEVVDESRKVGVVIEDGQVAADNQEAAA